MKRVFRIAAIATAMALPVGLFAQSSSTNPQAIGTPGAQTSTTGTQTSTTSTRVSGSSTIETGAKKKTAMKKKTVQKKHSKKRATTGAAPAATPTSK
jgi:hypothetical protein